MANVLNFIVDFFNLVTYTPNGIWALITVIIVNLIIYGIIKKIGFARFMKIIFQLSCVAEMIIGSVYLFVLMYDVL